MKKLRQIAIAITFCFSLMPLITFGKNIFIQNENLEPIKGASVTTYNNQMDSLGHFMSAEDGLCNILITQTTTNLIIEHPEYSSRLVNLSSSFNDTITLMKNSVSLKEIVVNGDLMTQHLTHQSYKIPLTSMEKYSNFFQSLNEIPNLVVLGSGALFYEGNQNVVLLLNGVETTQIELSSLSKDDIKNVDIYQTPPARFASQGAASVINVITKSSLTGGNISINANQSFYPLKGDNSMAMFYNYKRSRFSLIFNNENQHYRKYSLDEQLNYSHDNTTYEKIKEGQDSKSHNDENNLSLSFQNNKADSYLYNLNIGAGINHEKLTLAQNVISQQNETPLSATNNLSTGFKKIWVANYFEKNLGKESHSGIILGNVKWQRLFSNYTSSYKEFDSHNLPNINVGSNYKIRYDAIFCEAQYEFPSYSWGQLSIDAYNTYKYSKYLDYESPIFQKNNNFGTSIQLIGRKRKIIYQIEMGIRGYHTSSSSIEKSYNMWIPSPSIGIYYAPKRNLQFRVNYDYIGDIPTIADLSETNQWIDTKLVYHGNSTLKPYKKHDLYITGVTNNKYLNLSLKLGYSYSPDRICNYFIDTENYVLETIVNLKHYSVLSSQLDFTIKPLGKNVWTIWSRVIGAKVHGRGENYKWDGYRFQWMMNSRINLKKWTFEIFYQYPGKIAEGQLIRPRAECWSIGALYRPIKDLSLGIDWFMPFGKSFNESERTVGSAIVQNFSQIRIKDRANMISVSLSWNFSFGKNQNRATPQFDNGDADSGLLKK